jgi:hypothetical protein
MFSVNLWDIFVVCAIMFWGESAVKAVARLRSGEEQSNKNGRANLRSTPNGAGRYATSL